MITQAQVDRLAAQAAVFRTTLDEIRGFIPADLIEDCEALAEIDENLRMYADLLEDKIQELEALRV